MYKKISILLIVFMLSILVGCNSTTYSETVESNLIEEEDYIDHTSTYDGSNLSYDETMWYVNKLEDVPLPDPQVFVEDDVYYIVGTSDRNGNVIDCYSTEDFVTYEKTFRNL